jgi:hypothetical protein
VEKSKYSLKICPKFHFTLTVTSLESVQRAFLVDVCEYVAPQPSRLGGNGHFPTIIVLLFFTLFQEKWNKTKTQYALAPSTKEEEGKPHIHTKFLFFHFNTFSIKNRI